VIRQSVQAFLADDRKTDGVRFVDYLLAVAANVGEIKCTLAGDYGLRFELPGQQAFEVKIGRAKSKFRMFLPRFAVLCNASDGQDVSLFGGEGVIRKAFLDMESHAVGETTPRPNGSQGNSSPEGVAEERASQWQIRFQNTPGEQYVIIHAL
jgi:hypothetical protein